MLDTDSRLPRPARVADQTLVIEDAHSSPAVKRPYKARHLAADTEPRRRPSPRREPRNENPEWFPTEETRLMPAQGEPERPAEPIPPAREASVSVPLPPRPQRAAHAAQPGPTKLASARAALVEAFRRMRESW